MASNAADEAVLEGHCTSVFGAANPKSGRNDDHDEGPAIVANGWWGWMSGGWTPIIFVGHDRLAWQSIVALDFRLVSGQISLGWLVGTRALVSSWF